MLIRCPDCEAEVSDRAKSCPKCGCPVGYPDFYHYSQQYGFSFTWLRMDYTDAGGPAPHDNYGHSCVCAGSEYSCLFHVGDAQATRDHARAIAQAASERLGKIRENSEEARQLHLFTWHMWRLSQMAGAMLRDDHSLTRSPETQARAMRNLESTAEGYEQRLSECKHEDDRREFQEAAKVLRAKAAQLGELISTQKARGHIGGIEGASSTGAFRGAWKVLLVIGALALIGLLQIVVSGEISGRRFAVIVFAGLGILYWRRKSR